MGQLAFKSGKYLFFFFLVMLLCGSCEDILESQIPDVPVSFTINLSITPDLNSTGNAVYFPNVGYGGIIVYCALPGEEYYAFDATCPYEHSTCKVLKGEKLDTKNPPFLLNSPLVTCTCCGSKFIAMTYAGAYPIEGPATAPLKPYNTSMVNSFTLRVYN